MDVKPFSLGRSLSCGLPTEFGAELVFEPCWFYDAKVFTRQGRALLPPLTEGVTRLFGLAFFDGRSEGEVQRSAAGG